MSGRTFQALGLMVLAVFGNHSLAADPVRTNNWIQNDLAAAQAEARRTGKPIFATFRCER